METSRSNPRPTSRNDSLPGPSFTSRAGVRLFVSARPNRGGFVVRLTNVTHRTAADSMRGALLTVPEDNLAPLPEDTYYHFQLIDLHVFSDEGEELGVIAEILDTSANDVYVIRNDAGPDLLIPAIREVVLDVDVDSGRMTVHLTPGLR